MAKKKVDIISEDNKPVSGETKKELIQVDKRFVKVTPPQKTNTSSILIRNGRVYKKLDNQFGMYADNGEVFKL